jgi:hypothetical protein
MFEIIKWFMLIALLIAMAKASETLETLENLGLLTSDVLYDNILVLSALFNFFLLIITGLVFVLTLSSGFPSVFSNIMTVIIIVEFMYLLFVYGKVIPGYKGLIAERSTNKTKETIKIN